MHVVAHEPHAWFLLADGGAVYLDVNCSHSAVGFSMLIRLAENEAQRYREGGPGFLSGLARDVEEHGLSDYRERNVAVQLGAAVADAVARWRASGAPAGVGGPLTRPPHPPGPLTRRNSRRMRPALPRAGVCTYVAARRPHPSFRG